MTNIEKAASHALAKYDPAVVLKENTSIEKFRDVSSVALAVTKDCESLASIRKNGGEKLALSIIKVWIINLNDFLNLNRKMNGPQIDETAQMVYDTYYYFKPSDIALIMRRVKMGAYGQFYESIDGMKILDIFHKYDIERTRHFIDEMEREGENYRHEETDYSKY